MKFKDKQYEAIKYFSGIHIASFSSGNQQAFHEAFQFVYRSTTFPDRFPSEYKRKNRFGNARLKGETNA